MLRRQRHLARRSKVQLEYQLARLPSPVASTYDRRPTCPLTSAVRESDQLDPPELRAVWVDAFHDGFKTAEQVDALVAWARDANLNALFVQVRRRGDAYYVKSFEPRSEDPGLAPGFDALQYLSDRAYTTHANVCRSTPGWPRCPIWGERDTPPLAANHPFNLRGPSARSNDTWLMYRDDGAAWAGTATSGIYYLDPGNPEVQSYTTLVYTSLLRNYDVDGIHLDQVRYYEGDALRWGYNPASVAQRRPRPSSQWRRQSTVDCVAPRPVTALSSAASTCSEGEIKPNVAVTAAVVAWGKGPQTPDDWERQAPFVILPGLARVAPRGDRRLPVPMDYYREAGEQSARGSIHGRSGR